jgi:hypothetical protein
MKHKFINNVCINCKRKSEDLFYSMLDSGDEDIIKFNYNLKSTTYSSFIYSLEDFLNGKDCLSKDELIVYNIL